jgi:hypothetical protein
MLECAAIFGTEIESGSSVIVSEAFNIQGETGATTDEQAVAKPLTEADAIDIWIARWLRTRPKHLVARYGCDSRRLYEIWWGEQFPAAKEKAAKLFRERYPGLVERTSFGYRRIPRTLAQPEGRQLDLFGQPLPRARPHDSGKAAA